MVNPLKWHGGKVYLADWIIGQMPSHLHYVEPFFGGGAVLFRKPCEGVSEVANDLNDHLINFWKVLQDDRSFRELVRLCELTPFSQVQWEEAYEIDSHRVVQANWTVRSAWRFFVRYRQSRQGLGKDFATMSKTRTRRGMNDQVSSWLSAIEGLPEAAERLRRVVLFSRRACDVIRQQDGPDTLFYCDPPYLHSTRVTTDSYEHEMTVEDHSQLLETLSSIQGKFLLSGYRSDLYDNIASVYGWNRSELKIDNKASGKKKKDMKTECLWRNF